MTPLLPVDRPLTLFSFCLGWYVRAATDGSLQRHLWLPHHRHSRVYRHQLVIRSVSRSHSLARDATFPTFF